MGLRLLAEAVNAKNRIPPGIKNIEPLFFTAEKCFNIFLSAVKIEKGGFLVKNAENIYKLCFASGLDVTTFHKCAVPAEILKSLIRSFTEWTVLSGGNFTALRNFFSSQEYISITDIYLFPLDGENCFLFLIKSQKDASKENFDFNGINTVLKKFTSEYAAYKRIFESATPIHPFQYGTDVIDLKIKSALQAKNYAGLIRFSFVELFPDSAQLQKNINLLRTYYSAVNKIVHIIGKSNISILKPEKILYVCLFSAQKLPQDIYIEKIKSALSPVYGKDFCNKLIIEYAGSSTDIKEILEFFELNPNSNTDAD